MVSLRDAISVWGCAVAPLGAWSGRARQEGCGEECRARALHEPRGESTDSSAESPADFFAGVLVKKEKSKETLRLKSTI